MKTSKFLTALSGAVWLCTAPVQAWWAGGSKAVGLMAFQQLQPKTRAKLQAILAQHPDGGAYAVEFSTACVWPEDLRGKPGDHPTWHYRNKAFYDGVGENPIVHSSEDSLYALDLKRKVLRDPEASLEDKARSLSWIGHLVGDMHQPLHAATRCDTVHPGGDGCGVLFPLTLEGMARGNLHKFWDSMALEFSTEPSPQTLAAFVVEVETSYPRSFFQGKAEDRSPKHWLDESYFIAVHQAYAKIHPEDSPSPSYIQESRSICRQRIALAGYRLADLLEEDLGKGGQRGLLSDPTAEARIDLGPTNLTPK